MIIVVVKNKLSSHQLLNWLGAAQLKGFMAGVVPLHEMIDTGYHLSHKY